MKRVLQFIKEKPEAVHKLADGSIFHGKLEDDLPNGMGFVANFEDEEHQVLEQVYLGNFIDGRAAKFGYLIFEKGEGRYAG